MVDEWQAVPAPQPTAAALRFYGGPEAVVRPVPIPNTAVKRSLADGSGCIASARVGCGQIFLNNRSEHAPVVLRTDSGLRCEREGNQVKILMEVRGRRVIRLWLSRVAAKSWDCAMVPGCGGRG